MDTRLHGHIRIYARSGMRCTARYRLRVCVTWILRRGSLCFDGSCSRVRTAPGSARSRTAKAVSVLLLVRAIGRQKCSRLQGCIGIWRRH